MAALEPYIILRQKSSKLRLGNIEDSGVDNRLKKKSILLTLWRLPTQLHVFLLPVSFESGEWCHINKAWLPRQVENDGLRSGFFRDEFLQDMTSEA